jgi:hypothetical protein
MIDGPVSAGAFQKLKETAIWFLGDVLLIGLAGASESQSAVICIYNYQSDHSALHCGL